MVAQPSLGALLVFALIAVALVLFVTEALPPDITAIGVLVSLVVLEPYTAVTPETALSGFASTAVVTIIAMYILSAGVSQAGVVDWLGAHLGHVARGSDRRLLGATLSTTGLAAGVVNNTPVIAVFIPMIGDLADRYRVSPSKFLLPLSFAAMLGGKLTLVGSSLNLVASDLSATLLDHPIGMFEFTALGLLGLVVGLAYLLTVGWWLTPARVEPASDLVSDYELGRDLAQVQVREDSPLVGRTPIDIFLEEDLAIDLTVLQVERETVTEHEVVTEHGTDAEHRTGSERGTDADHWTDADHGTDDENADHPEQEPGTDRRHRPQDRLGGPDAEGPVTTTVRETFMASAGRPLEPGDRLTVRANKQVLNRFAEEYGCRQLPREEVDPRSLADADHPGMLMEAVVPPGSDLVGDTPAEARLRRRFDTTVLAVRRGDEVRHEGLQDRRLRVGDTLLLQTTEAAISYLLEEGDLVVTDEPGVPVELPTFEREPPDLDRRAPLSVGILVAVVGLAALTRLPIPVTALGGVVAMVATGCLRASDAYEAVSWNVIFLLAGILPLGVALDLTGGAAYLAEAVASGVGGLPTPVLLVVVYMLAALTAAVITPIATIAILVPIAVDLAGRVGASGFAFLLATLFGASAAFVTPIGYQTNLMVYGPGGYRFTDFLRVGAPLQLLLSLVTAAGIFLLYPV